jgi:hypothetical protein
MEHRDLLIIADNFLVKLKQINELRGQEYQDFVQRLGVTRETVELVITMMNTRRHLEEQDEFGSLSKRGKLFAVSHTYVEEYDNDYKKQFDEDEIRKNKVGDISAAKWYRQNGFIVAVISTVIALIELAYILVSKRCI